MEPERVPLRFTGRAGEYFRIWIVNVFLSVATLGIYSAWAKVRRKRYFYGNTLLQDAAFDYLADPQKILIGRVVVVVVWFVLAGAQHAGMPQVIVLVVVLVLLPELVIRAAHFNAVNSAYRGVRFGFGARFKPRTSTRKSPWSEGYRETSQFLILPIFLVPLSLGLLYPYYACRKRQFFIGHTRYGATPFAFDGTTSAFYLVYSKAALLFVLFLIGCTALLIAGVAERMFFWLVAIPPLYVLVAAYRDAAVGRLTFGHTTLGDLRFSCNWTAWALAKLYVVNLLAIVLSLGLLLPWAAIRTARYKLEGLSVSPASDLDAFIAGTREQLGAAGDEAGDLLGFDFGL